MIKELGPPAPAGNEVALAPMERNQLIRSLQTELQRVGCDPGGVTGEWHPKTRSALTEFARRAKLDLYTEKPSMPALDAVKARKDRICPPTSGAGMSSRTALVSPRHQTRRRQAQNPEPMRSGPRHRPARTNPASARAGQTAPVAGS